MKHQSCSWRAEFTVVHYRSIAGHCHCHCHDKFIVGLWRDITGPLEVYMSIMYRLKAAAALDDVIGMFAYQVLTTAEVHIVDLSATSQEALHFPLALNCYKG